MRICSVILFPVVFIFSLVAFSCAQAGPTIQASSVKLLLVQGPSGEFSERLSVFVLYDDPDGKEDFASIMVRHDDSDMFWIVDTSNATVRVRGPDRWIGTSEFAPPSGSTFPEGDYTVIASDLTGNEAYHTFVLAEIEFPENAPVRFSLEGDLWTMERNEKNAGFTENFLFVFNNEPRLIHIWQMPAADTKSLGDLDTFRQQFSDATFIQVYSEKADGKAGVLLSPVDMQ